MRDVAVVEIVVGIGIGFGIGIGIGIGSAAFKSKCRHFYAFEAVVGVLFEYEWEYG